MIPAAAILLVAYLIGAFPTAVLVARRLGHDATSEGSGNPGASNVTRVAGPRAGAVVFIVDIAKGALAAGAGMAIDGPELALACGLAAVVGHTRPPVRRKGGKGVATAGGTVLVLEPVIGLAAIVSWLVVVKVLGKASLASLLAAIGLPVSLAVAGRPGWEVAGIAVLSGYIVLRHADNIRRLLSGEESKMSGGRSSPA